MQSITHWYRQFRNLDLVQELKIANDILRKKNIELDLTYTKLLDTNLQYEELIEMYQNPKALDVSKSEYWNNRWQRNDIWYSAPNRKKVIEYCKYRNIDLITKQAEKIIKDHLLLPSMLDQVPAAVMDFTKKTGFKYVSEQKELWKNPEQTWEDRDSGNDCDDVALYQYFLMREIFIQLGVWGSCRHRLKLQDCHTFWHTSDPNLYNYAGRHLNGLWLASDANWYTIESTYFLELAMMNYLNKPQKNNPMYGLINYTFNEEFSWSQNALTLDLVDYRKGP